MDEEEASMVKKKISELEKELYKYQYNMGLLLIEKKEWISKNNQFEHALSETNELLERQRTAHIIAISEVEKREEKLRSALGVEKQCVHELEKALHEMRMEIAEIKFTAESKLEEAKALSSIVEEKWLEVEVKLHEADTKLAEVSRKASEIQRKSIELEAKENSLLKEHNSLVAEREAHKRDISHQREDLREWERKLQHGEERLAEARRLLNQREERANGNDGIFKQKQIELGETQMQIDLALSALKTKEDDMSSRIENLTIRRRQETDAMRNCLESKEKELVELAEKLKVREQAEIQKLRDEHKIILDAKQHDLELEMEQKRKSLDDSFKTKVVEVEKKEAEVNHSEAIISKREQALEKKLEKFKENEQELNSKSKNLKEREKSLEFDEKNLEIEKEQVYIEKEQLLNLNAELQKLRTEIEEQRLEIIKERERLQVTEEEKSEHIHLQSELKQEIEKYKEERGALSKERDDLKQEREKFEKLWEDLDDKKTEIQTELESLTEQKERMEKWNHLEEERLNNQRLETRGYVERELEALKLANDSFTANMEHEKSVLAEKHQSENTKMLQDFQTQKQELETRLQNREMEIENYLREKEELFEKKREKEQSHIEFLRGVARTETEEMKLERSRLGKEKQEILANQKHLEAQQLEMKKDIDDLVGLSMKLKDQREQFVKERERFISFVEKQKDCIDCKQRISEFMLSDLQSLEVNKAENFTLPRIADSYLKKAVQGTPGNPNCNKSLDVAKSESPASTTTTSWLKKCTSKIFIFSAGKKNEIGAAKNGMESVEAQEKLVDFDEIPKCNLSSEDEPQGQNKATIRGRIKVNRALFRKTIDGGHPNEESRGESDFLDKGASKVRRKRNRKCTSEQESDYNEESDGDVNRDNRNRRRKNTHVVEAPQRKRYNFWRPQIASLIGNVGPSSTPSKGEGVDGVGINLQPGPSTSFANGNHPEDSQADEFLKSKVAENKISNGTPQQDRELGNGNHEIRTPEAQEEEEVDNSEDEVEHP
ncbi:hypothetical protein OSB04_000160, partial [Centaurea solstitialis]